MVREDQAPDRLEAAALPTDRNAVNAECPAEADRTATLSPANRLAECEKDLAVVATDVSELVGDLARLRSDGDDLARLLAERTESIDRSATELVQLQAERLQLLEQAGTASEALRIAEARLAELNEHVEALARESHTLRAQGDEREARLKDAESELRRLQDALGARDDAVEQVRSTAQRAEHEADRWRRRSANLLLELAEATSDAPRAQARDARSTEADSAVEAATPSLGHLRLIAHAGGYRLSSSDDECPRAGDLIVVESAKLVVMRVGSSPLPKDDRPCAFLLPA